MSDPLVAEVVRGGIVESVHVADLAVVDAGGTIVDQAGDPLRVAAFRSSAKPLQAGILLEAGWLPAREEHLALACASHSGEPAHVEGVRAMLGAAGLDESALRCPEAWPAEIVPGVLAAAEGPARVFHNCSGKHAAMLVTCAVRGWPLESYFDAQHPLQQAIHETLESVTGTLLETAIDGCGVVTFAAPLAALARGFAAVRREPFTRAGAAMMLHPFLVAGTNRVCTAAMSALPGFVAKIGAEGLMCASAGGMSICFKVRDGSSRAVGPFLLEALRRNRLLPDPLPAALESWDRPSVAGGGHPVGEIRIKT